MSVNINKEMWEDDITVADITEIRRAIKEAALLYKTALPVNEIILPATLYQLFIINEDKDIGMSKRQFWSVENTLRNALVCYPHVKMFIVQSITSGEDARRIKAKIYGRTRTIVTGTRVPFHAHICAIGTKEKSARDYIFYVSHLLAKRGIHGRVRSISDNFHKLNHIAYCRRQAESFRQYGNPDFNFRKYLPDEKIAFDPTIGRIF